MAAAQAKVDGGGACRSIGDGGSDLAGDDGAKHPADPEQEKAAVVFGLARQASFLEALRLLEDDPSLWHKVEAEGYTLLHWGALGGHIEFARKAMAAGAEVDAHADNGQTPLMWAIIRGQVVVAKALMEAGADIYAKDSYGANPFVLAIQHQQHSALLLLLTRGSRDKLLRDADNNGCGPVMWAAYKGDLTSLKLLEYFDADFSVLDSSRMTPLHRAVQGGQAVVFEFLLDKEVNASQVDDQGRTCMDLALQHSEKSVHRALSRLLEVIDPVCVEVAGVHRDPELATGDGASVRRKPDKAKEDPAAKLKVQAMHNAAATFWLVSVSLTVFQYLTDLRTTSWELAPRATLGFELGVPLSLALFFLVNLSDPGKVPPRMKSVSGVEDLMKTLGDPAGGDVDFSRLCTTTWVLKGLRTKYCTHTGACVEEFDHFCGWLNVAIGKGNHRPFIFLAMVETLTQFCHLYLLWTVAGHLVHVGSSASGLSGFGKWSMAVASEYPLIMLLFWLQTFTAPGVLMLTCNQVRMVGVNITTNEMINAYRYEHFWQEVEQGGQTKRVFSNPFHKGNTALNCLDFWWKRRRGEKGPGGPGARLFRAGKGAL